MVTVTAHWRHHPSTTASPLPSSPLNPAPAHARRLSTPSRCPNPASRHHHRQAWLHHRLVPRPMAPRTWHPGFRLHLSEPKFLYRARKLPGTGQSRSGNALGALGGSVSTARASRAATPQLRRAGARRRPFSNACCPQKYIENKRKIFPKTDPFICVFGIYNVSYTYRS